MAPAFPAFAPRFPWIGGDLQTLRSVLVNHRDGLDRWPGERLEIPVSHGDRLVALLHSPAEDRGRPPALLVHGLTGCADSSYIRTSAEQLLSQGRAVLRLNLRGAGPTLGRSNEFYHAGRSDDLAAAVATLDARFPGRGIVAVGYSLGANILLKHLGEAGDATPIRTAISVSAPIDLAAASRRLLERRNRPYHDYLLRRMRAERTGPAARMTPGEREAARGARTIVMFDDRVVAPRNGFSGAEDYYARCAAARFLPSVRKPALLIHADDDPWIPVAAYRAVDWRANPSLLPLLPAGGGHVGFHGRGHVVPWHDRCIAAFLAEVSP